MASKPKYAELTFPRVSHSLLGYDIVSERHTEDGSTHLFLKLREKVQPPSMTRVIAALVDWELVTRAPHPTDRRQVILTVTPEGRSLVQRVRRRKEAWLAQRLAELSPQERATLREAAPILEKLSQS